MIGPAVLFFLFFPQPALNKLPPLAATRFFFPPTRWRCERGSPRRKPTVWAPPRRSRWAPMLVGLRRGKKKRAKAARYIARVSAGANLSSLPEGPALPDRDAQILGDYLISRRVLGRCIVQNCDLYQKGNLSATGGNRKQFFPVKYVLECGPRLAAGLSSPNEAHGGRFNARRSTAQQIGNWVAGTRK